jgi:anti-anti-sigma regulatory factor
MIDDETAPSVPATRRTDLVVRWGPASPEGLLSDVKEQLPSLLDTPPRALVVDLAGMTRLSSGAVTALLWAGGACRSRGVPIRLRHVPRAGVATLRRAGLGTAIELKAADS